MTRAQRRAQSSSENSARSNLVDAAATIIAREGDSAATSRAIASEAGENLGSITYYFGSKQALVGAAHAQLASRLIQPVVETLTSDRPAPERLFRAVVQLHALLHEDREQVVGYVQAMAAATRDPSAGEGLRTFHDELRSILASDIESQQQAAAIPDWVEAEAMANLILALANGVAITSAMDPERFDTGSVGQQFAALLTAARNER